MLPHWPRQAIMACKLFHFIQVVSKKDSHEQQGCKSILLAFCGLGRLTSVTVSCRDTIVSLKSMFWASRVLLKPTFVYTIFPYWKIFTTVRIVYVVVKNYFLHFYELVGVKLVPCWVDYSINTVWFFTIVHTWKNLKYTLVKLLELWSFRLSSEFPSSFHLSLSSGIVQFIQWKRHIRFHLDGTILS